MELSINEDKLTIIVIGSASPVYDFGTNILKKDREGKSVYKLPVLLQGTEDKRQDPTTTITFSSGDLVEFPKGSRVLAKGLTLLTWTMKGSDGQYRSGATLRAKQILPFITKA